MGFLILMRGKGVLERVLHLLCVSREEKQNREGGARLIARCLLSCQKGLFEGTSVNQLPSFSPSPALPKERLTVNSLHMFTLDRSPIVVGFTPHTGVRISKTVV